MKLILKFPLLPKRIPTNPFGTDNLCYNPKTKVFHLKPDLSYGGCKYWGEDFISFYGEYCGMLGHNGDDFAAKIGEPVYASLEGIVNEIETEIERGYGVGIVSENKYEVAGGEYQMKIRYWHLLGWCVKMGQRVQAGDLIGVADNTGWSTASHLHWEGKPVSNGVNVFANNGYYGAIDLLPFSEKELDLIPPITKNLFWGTFDKEIVYLKKGLKKLGYLLEDLNTEYYGNKTAEAVKRFQRDYKVGILSILKINTGKYFVSGSRKKFNELILK